jgi:hypothetical protein
MKNTNLATLALGALLALPAFAQSFEESGGGTDVQVLQAWYGNGINGTFGFDVDTRPQIRVDFSKCPVVSESESFSTIRQIRDCLPEVQKAARLDGSASQLSPMVGTYDEDTYVYKSSNAGLSSRFFGCSTVEIRTVSPKDLLNESSFDGLGLSYDGLVTFVPKNELHAVGEVTLKDGRAAVVHRFLGVALCKVAGAGKYSAQITSFNAFAQYQGRYRRWELKNGNHAIGFANGNKTSNGSGWGNTMPILPSSFDRQHEILR